MCNDYGEVAVLSRTLNLLVGDLTAGKSALKHQATHDALTGLANRALVMEYLEEQIRQAQDKELAVFYLDLDRFKRFNDSLGHAMGDELLKAVSGRLSELEVEHKIVGRQGGDEYVMVVAGVSEVEVARLASTLLASLERPYEIGGRELYASASLGVSIFPRDGTDAALLLKNAGSALHQAKRSGRSRWISYNAAMNAQSLERLTLESDLRRAMERKEFHLHYQPQINLQTGEIVGVEALLRWNHPRRGNIPPSDFIPIAEQSRLIVPIGAWVLETACRQVRRWLDEGLLAVPVAVNLSVVQFQQPDLVPQLTRLLYDTRLPTNMLKLEITESLLMEHVEDAIARMEQIRALGVQIAIDDFGTGYSSLSYLKRFPINQVKIDRTFVQDIGRNSSDSAIVRAVIALAHSLELEVVAEGVENQAQAVYLAAHGCVTAQGYHLGRPIAEAKLRELLNSRTASSATNHAMAPEAG